MAFKNMNIFETKCSAPMLIPKSICSENATNFYYTDNIIS